jgi:hypothetical protein
MAKKKGGTANFGGKKAKPFGTKGGGQVPKGGKKK